MVVIEEIIDTIERFAPNDALAAAVADLLIFGVAMTFLLIIGTIISFIFNLSFNTAFVGSMFGAWFGMWIGGCFNKSKTLGVMSVLIASTVFTFLFFHT